MTHTNLKPGQHATVTLDGASYEVKIIKKVKIRFTIWEQHKQGFKSKRTVSEPGYAVRILIDGNECGYLELSTKVFK
jgi:hypothetical protein